MPVTNGSAQARYVLVRAMSGEMKELAYRPPGVGCPFLSFRDLI